MTTLSKEIKLNHPQTFDDVSPDYDIKEKLRAYRAIIHEIKEIIFLNSQTVPKLAGMHMKNAGFMLGYTLAEIKAENPYIAGEVSRKLGEKIVVAPVDNNFKFKESVPGDNIEFCDFLRANILKLRQKLSDLYLPLAVFNTNPFVYFDRALQELTLAQAYIGDALYKIAKERDDYAIAEAHTKNTVEEPSNFNFQTTK